MCTASSCHVHRVCQVKPGATGRTWQGNSSSSFLMPQLCRFEDVSVGLRLSGTLRKGFQVSLKPAGNTPPHQILPGQEYPLHSSTGHTCTTDQDCTSLTRQLPSEHMASSTRDSPAPRMSRQPLLSAGIQGEGG